MKRLIFLCSVLALLIASPAVLQTKAQQAGAARPTAAAAQPDFQAMIKTSCATCHNSALPKPAGGLALDTANVQKPTDHPEIWEKVIRKLHGRLMPPPGSPQPDQKDIDSLVGYLETNRDALWHDLSNPDAAGERWLA